MFLSRRADTINRVHSRCKISLCENLSLGIVMSHLGCNEDPGVDRLSLDPRRMLNRNRENPAEQEMLYGVVHAVLFTFLMPPSKVLKTNIENG